MHTIFSSCSNVIKQKHEKARCSFLVVYHIIVLYRGFIWPLALNGSPVVIKGGGRERGKKGGREGGREGGRGGVNHRPSPPPPPPPPPRSLWPGRLAARRATAAETFLPAHVPSVGF